MSIELLGVIILSVVLAVVLFAYERLLGEVRKLKQDRETLELKARHTATRLVSEAREKAVEIVGEAKVDAAKWQEILDEELDKLIQAELGEYKERLQSVSKNVEEEVRSEAEGFKRALEMETVGAEKAVAEKIKERYASVEKEVEDYRLMKFRQVEEKAVKILEEVGRKAIGKALSFDDQADLIIEALEKAKGQNAI